MMRIAFLFAFPLVVACGGINHYRVLTGSPGPAFQGVVQIAMEHDPRPPRFTEVAILEESGYGTFATDDDVIRALQSEAAQLGCDGVLRMRIDHGGTRVVGYGVAVMLHGGPVRGETPVPVAAHSPTSVPAVPQGYESAVPPPAATDPIPPPPPP